MGWMDEYNKALKKYKKEPETPKTTTTKSNKTTVSAPKTSQGSWMDEYNKALNKYAAQQASDVAPVRDRITSRMTTKSKDDEDEEDERKWFEKGAFEDGYDFGDVAKTILGSVADVGENLGAGIMGMGEKALDALAYLAPAANVANQAQNSLAYNFDIKEYRKQQKEAQEFIKKDLYDEEKVAKAIISDPVRFLTGVDSEKDSVFGEKSDSLVQSGGQLLGTMGLQAVGVPWFVTSGVTSFGSEAENAFNQGASYEQAGLSAAVSAGAEMLTEKLFGGSGLGEKGLVNLDIVTRGISNKLVKALADYGVDMAAEGAEEVASQFASNFGSALYREENIKDILLSEEAFDEYLESFIGGAALGGFANASKFVGSAKKGTDYRSDFTQNEQKVVDKVYQDRLAELEKKGKVTAKQKSELYEAVSRELEKGYFSIEDIEAALGGKTYEQYKQVSEWEDSLQKQLDDAKKEYESLHDMKRGDMTGRQLDREAELSETIKKLETQVKNVTATSSRGQLKAQLSEEVKNLAKGDRLIESYLDKDRSKQRFTADLSKYDPKQRQHIQDAIDSGVLHNGNRSHEVVDFTAKVSSDIDVPIRYTNKKKIKEAGLHPKRNIKLQADGNTTEFDLGVKNLESGMKPVVTVDGAEVSNYTVDFENGKIVFQDAPAGEVSVTVEGTEIVDAIWTGKEILINVDSPRYLEALTGHELTHRFEKLGNYGNLAKVVKELAEARGEWESTVNYRKSTHKGIDNADAEMEAVADLVGKYLFTDRDFIMELSVKDRNVFQKIYDEIKYLCKVVTAGSKEARKLEQLKHEFEKVYREAAAQKNTADSGVNYALESKKQPGRLDPRTVTKADVVDMLHKVEDGTIYGNTYIPVRIGTPEKLIYWAEKRRGDVIENNPIAISAEKAYNAMNRAGETESGRPNKLSTDEVVAMIEAMNDPQYIVYQGANDRYVEVVKFDTKKGDKAFAVIEIGNNKDAVYMNGYEGGLYNILVTTYPPKSGKLKELLNGSNNEIIYDKNKDASQRTSSSNVPSVLNDASFFEDSLPDNNKKVKPQYSLSDSDGKQLTKEQQEYFKNSKMRDENGNLKVMYHGSQDAGFHVFDSSMSDDNTSFFFVDRNDVAASYSGTYETYEAKAFKTPEDANKFFESIGKGEYEVIEKDGKYRLREDAGSAYYTVAECDTLEEIYQEFCDYEGVGYGDANYKVYLNLKNPLEVDAKGRPWHTAGEEFSQETYDKYQSLTVEEKEVLADLAGWEDKSMFVDEIRKAVKETYDDYGEYLASAYHKLGIGESKKQTIMLRNLFAIASDNFAEDTIRDYSTIRLNTRDYAQRAKEQGYDGVIFKNIVDNGGYSNGSEGASTVAIAFDSNQIKSVANESPTENKDIRYSLTEYTPEKKKAHNKAVLDHFGKTYKWAETGYVLLDGTRLDLSGKHEGAPGGYRTVDHRDIVDALGSDYGDDTYSGSLVQFMSEGNIRISPECNGINLSVKPTRAQEQALSDFISRARGEVILDIDDFNGYTVASVEYPRGTHSNKVLNDIREWFDNGKKPEVSNLSQFRYSLSEQGEYAPTFYSHMEKVVDDTRQQKLGAASVVNMLRGKGVKAEEIKWSGIEDWLDGKKSVTKAELLEFIKGSQLQIEETVLDDEEGVISYTEDEQHDLQVMGDWFERRMDQARELWQEAYGEEMPWDIFMQDDVSSAISREVINRNGGIRGFAGVDALSDAERTLYLEVTEGMRRLDLQMAAIRERAEARQRNTSKTNWGQYKLNGGENYREYLFKMPGSDYRNHAMDVHWKGETGVLAHARVQDFDTADGKMLFIEEIQSDWHNEGQKMGYADKRIYEKIHELEGQREKLETEREEINREYDSFLMRYWEEDLSDEEYREYLSVRQVKLYEISSKSRDIEREIHRLTEQTAVPDAPFKNNYHEFVLKRLIREAAEKGYDSIGWTSADIQSDRWSEDYAEGYRIEYDQDIPKFLNKYGKKWGAKVGKTDIQTKELTQQQEENLYFYADMLEDGESYIRDEKGIKEIWTMPITEAMKKSVLYEGQPMYSLSFADEEAPLKSRYGATLGKDVRFETEDIAPTKATAEDMSAVGDETAPTVSEMIEFPDDGTSDQEELEQLLYERDQLYGALETALEHGTANEVSELAAEYEALNSRIKAMESKEAERTGSLTDEDDPGEMEELYPGESDPVSNPFENRDWYEVGTNRSARAFMVENPEFQPFFQNEAMVMMGDYQDTQRAERWYNDELHYKSGGEQGFGGQKRLTSQDIETLLDDWGLSYAQIEEGLTAIIENNDKVNNAPAKRIEFMLNRRLLNGYKDFHTGKMVRPSQEYLNMVREWQANQQAASEFDNFMPMADQYAPEEIAPVLAKATPDTVDAPVFEEKGGQTTMFEPEGSEETKANAPTTRKELHQNIMDKIKSIFTTNGFDFDNVLKNAKNLSTFATVDNTPQRVMEKALGRKEGGILADITVNQVAQNETQKIRWLNNYIAQVKRISQQYHIKPGSKESAAAQMYAEGFYVNDKNEIVRYGDPELIQDFRDANVRRNIKGLAGDVRIRQIYDEVLTMINESRTRNAYPEIPKLDNYFLHFRAMEDTFSRLGIPFNPNDIKAKDLPTDLNGVTADLKPGQPYFASAMHREGKRTSFDLLGGLEKYLNSAANQIYHIDDIQTLRALRNYIADSYGQAKGLENLDDLSQDAAFEQIEKVYNGHLSTFAKFLNEEANVIAGKTALIDRGLEGVIGRRGMTFLNTLNGQVGSNMVGYNISSSLTNFLPVVQTLAKTNKFDFTKAFAQTVANKLSGGKFDSFAEDSPVVIRRKGSDRFYQTPWQKIQNPGYVLMGVVDDISTEIIARTKYNEFIRKGLDSQQAHFETDKWVSRLMGDRSLGQQPQLFNSKLLGLVTKFQLEVRNQLDAQFYDTIQEAKASNEDIQNGLLRNAKTAAKVASVFTQLAVGQHLYGMAFEKMAGYNPAFDIISVLMTAFGFDDDEDSEDTALDNIEQGFMELLEDMPYASTFLEGGRIPISSALPIEEFVKGEDKYGNEKSRWEIAAEVAPYYALPAGYGQIKKTVQGLSMFSDDHPIAGSYTDSGNLRFPVEDTFGSKVKAAVFGQYASENARKYFNEEQRTLNPEQTEIFAGLDIPIEEYWEYRDNLNKFYDLKDQLSEKADADGATDEDILKSRYINAISSDIYGLYDEQKEIAGDNILGKKYLLRELQKQMEEKLAESKEAVNNINIDGKYATIGDKRFDYSDYSGMWYEIEGEYLERERNAVKRYGITPSEYWNNTDLYYHADWYFDDKYATVDRETVARVVFGGKRFAPYASDLGQIKGEDKNGDGKTDNGSKKENVYSYIAGLNVSDIEKNIMRKMSYPSEDKYNADIISYVDGRTDISYEDKITVLEGLGFKVDSEGYVTWD